MNIDQCNVPSPARMYDYFLGGSNNLPVDRDAAAKIIEIVPNLQEIAWENRNFLHRAVRYLARQGIRQYIDIGAGLPTQGNVHEIAMLEHPDSRVVYVDNDAAVVQHAETLLLDTPSAIYLPGDLRKPEAIFGNPRLRGLIDLRRPVAVILVAMLHFIEDHDCPENLLRSVRSLLAPGSYIALTHLTSEGTEPAAVTRITEVYRQAGNPVTFRTRHAIRQLFADGQLVPPGIVRPCHWHADTETSKGVGWLLAGVERCQSASPAEQTT